MSSSDSKGNMDAAFGSTRTELDLGQSDQDVRARPFLFLVLEAERPLAGGARFALDDLDEVLAGRSERIGGRQVSRGTRDGKRSLSIRMSGQFLSKDHAAFRRTGQNWTVEDLGSRNGVYVNGTHISGPTALGPGDLVSLGRAFFIFEFDETDEVADLDAEDVTAVPMGFLTLLPGLAQKYERLRKEAARTTSITLVGETGTGKEVLARGIHAASKRPGRYVAVNCGAIARELIQSELFGHVKGAFSGATDARGGYVRDAHEGTLLLDEIVAAPPAVQVALLRAIQEKAVTPVGSTRPHPADVRFVAAAQRPLSDAVEEGEFRADLQARLEAFVFELPPLRERLEDIGILVASSLRGIGVEEKHNPRLSFQAATRILRYEWPRNIRELAQAVDVAWGGAKNGEIGESDLPKPKVEDGSPRSRLRQQLIGHLRAARGNVAEVARKMGRTRPLVYHYLKRFEIDPETFRSG